MADIMYLQDEDAEEVEDQGCDTDPRANRPPSEVLSPLARLEKCASSDKVYNRQVAARLLLDTLRSALDNPSDISKIIEIIRKLGEDNEPGVRAELAEQIANLSLFFNDDKIASRGVIVEDLLPLVVKYLADTDNQVRKTSQDALIAMIEQRFIDTQAIEEKVCPVILMLTEKDTWVEFHTLAVTVRLIHITQEDIVLGDAHQSGCDLCIRFISQPALMSVNEYLSCRKTGYYRKLKCEPLMGKLAPLIGCELTEKLFLMRFAAMCKDQVFYVRKVCAGNIGDFCAVVSCDSVEEVLIPKFMGLCVDEIWGVRKACAEVFMSVSCSCSMKVRKDKLAWLFANLLEDPSRWVRMSAFQSLGPFISTFCDPDLSGLTYSRSGELILVNPEAVRYKEMLSLITKNQVCDSELSRVSSEDSNSGLNGNICGRGGINIASCSASSVQALLQGYEQWSCNPSPGGMFQTAPISAKLPGGIFNSDGISVRRGRGMREDSILIEDRLPPDGSEETSSTLQNSTEDNKDTSVTETCDSSQSGVKTEVNNIYVKETDQRLQIHSMNSYNMDNSCQMESECPVIFSSKQSDPNQLTKKLEEAGHISVKESDKKLQIHVQPTGDSYNTFQFWRAPIPELQLDISLTEEGKPSAVHVKALVTDVLNNCMYSSELNVDMEVIPQEIPSPEHLESSKTEVSSVTSTVTSSNTEHAVPVITGETVDNLKKSNSIGVASASIMNTVFSARTKVKELLFSSSCTPITDASKSSKGSSTNNNVTTADNIQKPSVVAVSNSSIRNTQANQKRSKFKLFKQTQEGLVDNITCIKQTKEENETKDEVVMKSKEEVVTRSSVKEEVQIIPIPPPAPVRVSPKQNIVPEILVDQYVSMVHPSQAQNTDNEIAHHCAFSIPAVALTLGRENWHLLKEAYETLAGDLQWKVRRTVASSIHELAVILGEDIATQDLVPVFSDFIRDLDEVRIGALKHLADFMKLIKPNARNNSFLPRLSEFLLTDNEWNWRFRQEFAEQLLMSVNLFDPPSVQKFLVPLGVSLLMDRVACVREVSLRLMTQLVKRISSDVGLLHKLLKDIAEQFAHCKKWVRRQTYTILSSHLVRDRALPEEIFASDIFPVLVELSWDAVPNVRLTVARCISMEIIGQSYFSNEKGAHVEVMYQVIERLQNDNDKDVRFCAHFHLREVEESSPGSHIFSQDEED